MCRRLHRAGLFRLRWRFRETAAQGRRVRQRQACPQAVDAWLSSVAEPCPVNRARCGCSAETSEKIPGPESGRKRKRTRKLFSQVLEICGAAGEIRTPGLQVRSLLLYPAELQPHPEKRSIPSWISSQAFFAPFFLFSVFRWRKFGGGAGTSASIGWPLS